MDFSEFPLISKKAWLEQVAKDLKDKPLDSLLWQVSPGLTFTPLVHAEDAPAVAQPLATLPHTWQIGEEIAATDVAAANRQALEALAFGAEALQFHLPEQVDAAYLRQLLQGIHLDFVSLHFDGPAVAHNPGAVLAALKQVASEQGIDSRQLRGSLVYDPLSHATLVDWRYLADIIAFAKDAFPGFRLVRLGAAEVADDAVEELAQLLHQGNVYVQKLTERGLSAAEVAATLQFQISIGKRYFLQIAKIRSFKTLWLNVLQGWKAPLTYPELCAGFAPAAYTDEVYTNMIRATTMAMSAVIGGVNRLHVRPYGEGRAMQVTYPPEFGRRIARNVQHLLKMESGLEQIADPAAGSYYLENMTSRLNELAWARFVQPVSHN